MMFESLDAIKDFLNNDSIFWFCALAGSGMFVIQFILNLVGIGEHEVIDEGGGEDFGRFNWFSRQALTGFLMMFGWTALTCRKEFGQEGLFGMGMALAAGIATMFATGSIFKLAKKLHSPGTVFNIEDSLGKEGMVYHRIPKDGTGKIFVTLNDFTHEIEAVSHNNEELPSFTRVQIIKKADDKTVIVTTL